MRMLRALFIALSLVLLPGASVAIAAQAQQEGVKPVWIEITSANVDAPLEPAEIANGQITAAKCPWVVYWFEVTPRVEVSGPLGRPSNVVIFGAPNWVGIGPAIFGQLSELGDGHEVNVVGEDGKYYRYEVETVATYDPVTAATETFAPTGEAQILTLFSYVEPWNAVTQQYDNVLVVTASRDQDVAADPATPETTADTDREAATSDPNCLKG